MKDNSVLLGYIERVYGYAVKRTYSRDEADELAQQILFTAVSALPKLRDGERFEPWLWKIAANVTKSFRRNMGKRRATFSYDSLDTADLYFCGGERTGEDTDTEIYDNIRFCVTRLSLIYRETVIFYYYDGLSVKQIAEKTGVPEGTVAWRLSEARNKIKKECTDMTETALRPLKMRIDITGSGNYDGINIPFPSVFIGDTLSQNILFHCYETPKNIEELAKLCGVPAYYIEDRIQNLLYRDAVKKTLKGSYSTDFIIYTDKVGRYSDNAEKIVLPLIGEIIGALDSLTEIALKAGFYTAGKSRTDLWYLCGAIAFISLEKKYNPVPHIEIEKKYDGNRFNYTASMESGEFRRTRMSINRSDNLGSEGTYSYTTFCFGGYLMRKLLYDYQINICEDILSGREIHNTEIAAGMIKDGCLKRSDIGSLSVMIPAFSKEQKRAFDESAEKTFAGFIGKYRDAVQDFASGYKKLFPKHLSAKAENACGDVFIGLYSIAVKFAQEQGKIEKPSEGSFCDVLVQFK